MFAINWTQDWQALAVTAQADRRVAAGRDPKGACIYLTAKRAGDYLPAPLLYIDQETIGL